MVHWFGHLGEDGVHRYIYPSVRYESHVELRAWSCVCCVGCSREFTQVSTGVLVWISTLACLQVTISRWTSAIVAFITVFLWPERTHQTGYTN